MKVVCVLIAFTLVNVMADHYDMRNFKLQVFMTNGYIQKAYNHNDANGNGLVNIIKKFVRRNLSMEELNVLFGILEHCKPEEMQTAASLQTTLRMKIRFSLGIDVISDDPQVVDIYLNPETLNLTKLGEERRKYTDKALENIITSGLQFKQSNRGELIPEFRHNQICCIVAMYKNTKLLSDNSYEYINHTMLIFTRDAVMCALTSKHENLKESTIYYKWVGDQIVQVWPDKEELKLLLNNQDNIDQGSKDNSDQGSEDNSDQGSEDNSDQGSEDNSDQILDTLGDCFYETWFS